MKSISAQLSFRTLFVILLFANGHCAAFAQSPGTTDRDFEVRSEMRRDRILKTSTALKTGDRSAVVDAINASGRSPRDLAKQFVLGFAHLGDFVTQEEFDNAKALVLAEFLAAAEQGSKSERLLVMLDAGRFAEIILKDLGEAKIWYDAAGIIEPKHPGVVNFTAKLARLQELNARRMADAERLRSLDGGKSDSPPSDPPPVISNPEPGYGVPVPPMVHLNPVKPD